MRINNISSVKQATVPRSIVRCRSYRNIVGQWFLGPCGSSNQQLDNRIIEEEENEMVDNEPTNGIDEVSAAQSSTLNDEHTNGNNWQSEHDDDSSDKDDEDEVEEANIESSQSNVNPITPVATINTRLSDPPEIKVTIDDSLLAMAHEYRENFDGFVEINRFDNIEEMHDFIKITLEAKVNAPEEAPSNKQDLYLDIFLNERPDARFRKLFDTSRATVRRVLARNEDILQELFTTASFDHFPCALASIDDADYSEEEDLIYENPQDSEVNENMKKWYMIEIIGLWLKMITDVASYREAIKKYVLKKCWGIENDRYEGIAVPLKYK